jgi:hypothetical protein
MGGLMDWWIGGLHRGKMFRTTTRDYARQRLPKLPKVAQEEWAVGVET